MEDLILPASSSVPRADVGDTLVDLEPSSGVPKFAYGISKRCWTIGDSGALVDPRSASLRVYESAGMALLRPGSDGLAKPATDVVIEGAAYGPNGRPAVRVDVCCSVGAITKRVAVLGRRLVEWSSAGHPRLGAPEPFEVMPMINRHAYGGVDGRVPFPAPRTELDVLRLVGALPGMYCRNPAGKGYLASQGRIDGIELPNLEDPADLLTPERLVANPAEWWKQPIPCTLGWRDLAMFPRLLAMGSAPWFEAPDDDRLEEVRRGYLPPGHRADSARMGSGLWLQEASLGMWFHSLEPGTPIVIEGMHPERAARFEIPRPPLFEFSLESFVDAVPSKAISVLVRPFERRVEITYRARTSGLPRPFVPGIHKYIPLKLRVEGSGSVEYQSPPTVHDALVSAGLRNGAHQ